MTGRPVGREGPESWGRGRRTGLSRPGGWASEAVFEQAGPSSPPHRARTRACARASAGWAPRRSRAGSETSGWVGPSRRRRPCPHDGRRHDPGLDLGAAGAAEFDLATSPAAEDLGLHLLGGAQSDMFSRPSPPAVMLGARGLVDAARPGPVHDAPRERPTADRPSGNAQTAGRAASPAAARRRRGSVAGPARSPGAAISLVATPARSHRASLPAASAFAGSVAVPPISP